MPCADSRHAKSRKNFIGNCLYLFFLILPSAASAQRPFNDDYYLSETSKPLRVNDILQDSIGFMWLATDTGLSKFNGQGNLTPIHDAIHDSATAVYEANCIIYVGYANGMVGRVYRDSIVRINILLATPRSRIRDMYVTNSGIVFLCTEEGVYMVLNGYGFLIDARLGLSSNNCYSVAPSPDGDLLVGTDMGIDQLGVRQGKIFIQHFTHAQGLPDGNIKVLRGVRHTACVWVGTDNGVARMLLDRKTGGWKISGYKSTWPWGRVSDILPRSAHQAWAAMEKDFILNISAADSLAIAAYRYEGKSYTKMLRSKSGNIWLGTTSGLSSLSVDFARFIPLNPPYALTAVASMACDPMNTIWYAAGNQLFQVWLAGASTTPQPKNNLPSEITCLHVDTRNGLWIGTAEDGVWYRNGAGELKKFSETDAWVGADIFSITSRYGHLWVAGLGGVAAVDVRGEKPSLIQLDETLGSGVNGPVFHLFTDRSGRVWMATESAGVCMYDDKGFHRWDSAAGLTAKTFYTLAEDAAGHIWAGSPGHGVFRFDEKRWQRFGRENGLQDLSIATIAANKTGQVIIVNSEGVDQWYPGNRQFRRYNPRTGPSIDTVSQAINCSAADRKGNVYIPIDGGLCLFNNIHQPLELKPAVHINELTVFQKPAPLGKDRFAYNQNHISFHYEGVNFVNIEPLHFRYRLEGFSDEWTESTQGVASFPQLAPGSYRFRLQASLDNDFEEATEATYSFEITPPLWKRVWFIGLAACTLALLIHLYVKRREQRIRNVAQLKQERIQFEYELLKNQVDPHFLFNSLNILTNLIEENQEHAIKYTVQLSALYRNILSYRNKETILLAEECKLLSAYIHIQKRRFGHALHVDTSIPREVLETGKVVPLALQFLVENAIKHSRVSLSDPLLIRIFISAENELVVLNPLRPKVSSAAGEGLGLQNIQKRYSQLTKKPVWHGVVNGDFIVKLPLL